MITRSTEKVTKTYTEDVDVITIRLTDQEYSDLLRLSGNIGGGSGTPLYITKLFGDTEQWKRIRSLFDKIYSERV